MLLKNGHVIVAMLVAPVLAVISYFAVDFMVRDDPQVAQPGDEYRLISRSNCRYESGECVMENGEFRLTFTAESTAPDRVMLRVSSAHPLQGIQAAWADNPDQDGPSGTLSPVNGDRLQWQGEVPATSGQDAFLRVAAKANDAVYFGQTHARFMNYETSYGEDFRINRGQ
ncbi:MAG: hypothetical protein EA349_08110 [Halomonadaceae bacterium]|nr:MAG: hypothetical protein EA349_08110 [Halomonadaceae bacterium]